MPITHSQSWLKVCIRRWKIWDLQKEISWSRPWVLVTSLECFLRSWTSQNSMVWNWTVSAVELQNCFTQMPISRLKVLRRQIIRMISSMWQSEMCHLELIKWMTGNMTAIILWFTIIFWQRQSTSCVRVVWQLWSQQKEPWIKHHRKSESIWQNVPISLEPSACRTQHSKQMQERKSVQIFYSSRSVTAWQKRCRSGWILEVMPMELRSISILQTIRKWFWVRWKRYPVRMVWKQPVCR